MITVFTDEYFGAFLKDSTITEIVINKEHEIWTENFSGWEKHTVDMPFQKIFDYAKVVANFNKKDISRDNPIFSGSLKGGERIQIVIPPACKDNHISITIRKPSIVVKSLDELDAEGSFNDLEKVTDELTHFEIELMQLLEAKKIKDFLIKAVQYKRNIIISGKTGSGKTTITRSLIECIPTEERLVTIEDVHELFLDKHENKTHLFYTRDNEAGFNVDAKSALASCLRMKPDRILLAELRGDETLEYIHSVNTGHPGSITTTHANSALDTFSRLTDMMLESAKGSKREDIETNLYSTIDIVLFYDKRKLKEIYYNPIKKYQIRQRIWEEANK